MTARAWTWIPIAQQLRAYTSQTLLADLGAGVTVAAMLIPQGMAYAMLAGLPPVVGLYASIFPLLAYAALGTSRQLAVGPVAMDSLLVATAVGAIAQGSSADYVGMATVLALLVGGIQLLMGVLRLGFIVNFLSKPVIAGFTSAAALVIAYGQLPHILGVDFGSPLHLQELSANFGARVAEVNGFTLLVAAISLATLLVVGRINKRLPGPLFALVITTVLVSGFGLSERGVSVLGEVPSGLPSPRLSWVTADTLWRLLPSAVTIALIGFLEAISVSKSFASKHRYEVRPNQELIALGAANASAYAFGAYPVTGGFSRTAVNDAAGAQTAIASVFSAMFVLVAVALLTPFLSQLPQAALAAIVLLAVSSLFDYEGFVRFWRVKRADAGLFVVAFSATLLVGIQHGILLGVVASLAVFIYQSTHPHSAELGLIPGTTAYRNFKNFPEAEPVPGVLILRIDASFYFANVEFFKTRIERLVREDSDDCRALLIDASGINSFDSSADAALRDILFKLRAAGRELHIANVKGPVRSVMKASGLWQEIGEDHIFLDVHEAVESLAERQSASRFLN